MPSPTTPVHGKMAAIFRRRPNGFKGNGLNDLSWGAYTQDPSSPDSAHFEVVIDHAGTPDTFKWRVDGGAWTEDVAITGAVQGLNGAAGDQSLLFAATTGHTVGDQWSIGNLWAEATTEATSTAQITDTARRLLNPNHPPTWTDSGGKVVNYVDYTQGKAYFNGNVANVTVAGDDAYIMLSGLEKVGYLLDWSLQVTLDMADASRCGQQWKESLPGQAGGSGSANAFFIGGDSFFDGLSGSLGGDAYYFLQLYTSDADQDQTGDHFNVWVTFPGLSVSAPMGELVKEQVSFQLHGIPSFTADA